jgi:hypothetical protein
VAERGLELLALAEEVERLNRLLHEERAAGAGRQHARGARRGDAAAAGSDSAAGAAAPSPARAGTAGPGPGSTGERAGQHSALAGSQPEIVAAGYDACGDEDAQPYAREGGDGVHGADSVDAHAAALHRENDERAAARGGGHGPPGGAGRGSNGGLDAEPGRGSGGAGALPARQPAPAPAQPRRFSLWAYITGADRLPAGAQPGPS